MGISNWSLTKVILHRYTHDVTRTLTNMNIFRLFSGTAAITALIQQPFRDFVNIIVQFDVRSLLSRVTLIKM